MPPRLDMTPYWLIVPVAIVLGLLTIIALVAVIILARRSRRDDER